MRWVRRTNMSILDPSTLLSLILSRNIGTRDKTGYETKDRINQEVKLVLDEYQVRTVKIPSEEKRQELLNLFTNLLEKEDFIRELAEISVVMLGGKLPGDKPWFGRSLEPLTKLASWHLVFSF